MAPQPNRLVEETKEVEHMKSTRQALLIRSCTISCVQTEPRDVRQEEFNW